MPRGSSSRCGRFDCSCSLGTAAALFRHGSQNGSHALNRRLQQASDLRQQHFTAGDRGQGLDSVSVERFAGKRVGLVLCGGNIDLDLFRAWVMGAA